VASAAAFALGAATRVTGPLAASLHLLFVTRNPYAFAGWAEWVVGPLFYVALAPVGRRLAVDACWRARRGLPRASASAAGWPLRLLQLHVCAMYLAAGWSRLDRGSWLSGEMVEIALTSATHGRLPGDWSALAPLLALATWVAMALELAAPVALWLPRLRRGVALALVLMHAGLELVTNVGWWGPVMIAGLCAFLLPWRGGPARRAHAPARVERAAAPPGP
jgi:hypothetical protein